MVFYNSIVFIPLFLLIIINKNQKIFLFLSLLYPLIFIFVILYDPKESFISMLQLTFLKNYNAESKIIAIGFLLVVFTINLYSYSRKMIFEIINGCFYCIFAIACIFSSKFIEVFTFLEITTIASTIFIFIGEKSKKLLGVKKYFLVHFISSIMILASISLLMNNKVNIDLISFSKLERHSDFYIAYILMLLGLVIHTGCLPIVGLVVDCYTLATNSGFMYLTSFSSKISIFIMLKMFYGDNLLKILGLIIILNGSIRLFKENNIRNLLCYLSITQTGFLITVVGCGCCTSSNITIIMLSDLASKSLFTICMFILEDSWGVKYLKDLTKINVLQHPLLLGALLFSVFTSTNTPLLKIFQIKTTIFNALSKNVDYYIISFYNIVTYVVFFNFIYLIYKKSINNYSDKNINLFSNICAMLAVLISILIYYFIESFYFNNPLKINEKELTKYLITIFIAITLVTGKNSKFLHNFIYKCNPVTIFHNFNEYFKKGFINSLTSIKFYIECCFTFYKICVNFTRSNSSLKSCIFYYQRLTLFLTVIVLIYLATTMYKVS